MKVIVFGATGMVGQGVLRECLRDPDVTGVLVIGRKTVGTTHPKLIERVLPDLADLSSIETDLAGAGACFFCLGVSAAGLREDTYRRITYDLTLAVARTLVRLNPGMTFVYVSGAGTDSTEKGRAMWARVKGATENALLALPFKSAVMFRPGVIQPLDGIRSSTRLYRWLYTALAPFMGLLKRLFPNQITTTRLVGRAMLAVAKLAAPQRFLENRDINALGTT
jgi:uncharacterized protein YbjT (DUF2867 family)